MSKCPHGISLGGLCFGSLPQLSLRRNLRLDCRLSPGLRLGRGCLSRRSVADHRTARTSKGFELRTRW